MVTLVKKTGQNLRKFETHHSKCHKCERDLYEYIHQEGAKVWKLGGGSRASYRTRYYCDDCKKDLFEGVKLRNPLRRDVVGK